MATLIRGRISSPHTTHAYTIFRSLSHGWIIGVDHLNIIFTYRYIGSDQSIAQYWLQLHSCFSLDIKNIKDNCSDFIFVRFCYDFSTILFLHILLWGLRAWICSCCDRRVVASEPLWTLLWYIFLSVFIPCLFSIKMTSLTLVQTLIIFAFVAKIRANWL